LISHKTCPTTNQNVVYIALVYDRTNKCQGPTQCDRSSTTRMHMHADTLTCMFDITGN